MTTVNHNEMTLSPHPGLILKGEIEEQGLSQRELAVAIGKSAAMVNGLLNGNKDITVELAILLETALPGSLSANEWLRLQNDHDLEVKRLESSLNNRLHAIEIWNFLRSRSNLSALKRRLCFDGDFEGNISKVMNALGITTVQELETKIQTSQASFKKSEKVQTDSSNLFTWTVIVKHASQSQNLAAPFDKSGIPELIGKLNYVFYTNTDVVEKTKQLLNEYGIKFITDEKRLDKVPVDGYSFWIGDNPTIVATQRMNRIDNFAFTIMHELGHIDRHLERDIQMDFIDVDHSIMQINKQEEEANEYATHALWDGESPEDAFSEIVNPYAAGKILKFISRRKEMNVGIVAGQYQFFCHKNKLVMNPYTVCRELIGKIG